MVKFKGLPPLDAVPAGIDFHPRSSSKGDARGRTKLIMRCLFSDDEVEDEILSVRTWSTTGYSKVWPSALFGAVVVTRQCGRFPVGMFVLVLGHVDVRQ